jgi:uncharacterized damage-inducible protein DinB
MEPVSAHEDSPLTRSDVFRRVSMNGKDALKLQFGSFYRLAKMNLEGITAVDSIRQPRPGGNCANWILGHLVGAQNSAMGLAKQTPVWEDDSLARASSTPITSAEGAIDWDTLVERFVASESRFLSGLDALTEDELDEDGFVDPFGNPTTRGQLLNFLALHQNYHVGQLGMTRRLIGLPGAITDPRG